MSGVVLQLGDRDLVGWRGVEVSARVDEACRAFSFPVGTAPDGLEVDDLLPAQACRVLLDGHPVVTGWTDADSVSDSRAGFEVAYSGRSRTQDVVDSDPVAAASWTSATPEKIAADICAPFGVEVVAEVDTGGPLGRRFRVQRGESAMDALDRLARQRALLVTDDGAGRLVLTRGEAFPAAVDDLVYGGNVLEIARTRNLAEVFSEYVCRGARASSDTLPARPALRSLGRATDDVFPAGRVRRRVIQPDGPVDSVEATRQAVFEAAYRAGRSLVVTASVRGWVQSDGSLWRPGLRCWVEWARGGVLGELAVVGAAWSASREGAQTSLELWPVDALKLLEPRRGRRGTRRADGAFAALSTVKLPAVTP